MKLNIFRIPPGRMSDLRNHLQGKGLISTKNLDQDGWKGDFLFSTDPIPGAIQWVKTFSDYIGSGKFNNRSYFAVILLEKADSCFAIAFGKAHFFVRPFCDYNFGIEMAKRIADEKDIAQTASRRYQGRQRKDIRSFTNQTRLNIPPGSSVDFLQGRVIKSKQNVFGPDGKFGTSCLLYPSIEPDEIGEFLSNIIIELKSVERFKLPRTLVLSNDEEVAFYDRKLIDELTSPIGISDISTNTFDLFGVDFVFSSSGSFTLNCGHYKKVDIDRLTMKEVKEYISDKSIPRKNILSIKITHHPEDGADFTQSLKECVDFICDEDHVVLRGGKWLKFNEDYLESLDAAIRRIAVETTENELTETALEEGAFNKSLINYGYEVADKDFQILKTNGKAPTEAWDLQKQDTVYAVKFGTPQKLNYVVDQASSVLELIHNGVNLYPLPPFKRYCLWMGYRAKKQPLSLADSGSIILKQKVESWARQCEEVGYIPVLKLSRKLNQQYDLNDKEPKGTGRNSSN
ncbi:MAG: DUF6119 family protein [Bifidobacterium crudilactis]|jgi:uncharacterized protein (TIGR04141 family)